MKKIVILLVLIITVSCKNESKSEEKSNTTQDSEMTKKQKDGLTLLKGEFIYVADAAVLQTQSEIYAVILNEKMHELDEMAKKYKAEPTDMVPVEIRGKITPRPENEEGWDLRVEIVEILNVSKPNPESSEIITIGKE